MRKVLILANNDGGLYKFRLELIEQLVKKYEVYIALPNGKYIPRLQEEGCKYIDVPINRRGINPITDLKLIMKYKRIIKNVKPDVVLTYTIKPNVYGGIICRITRIPYLANITGLGSAIENGGILKKIALFLYKVSLKDASCIFFQNSENQKVLLEKKVKGNHNRLIPGSGVNPKHFALLEYPNEDIINFLYIGRIMKEKGIEQYLDAAIYFQDKTPNVAFYVVGFCEEDYDSKLNELKDRGTIKYYGFQDDIREFHKISHCTIHPTYYAEGMSNVLLESAACGRPIITTNRSGCREIIDDGINGYLFEQKNSHDLIEKIDKFIRLGHKDKRIMGLASRKKVENEFDRALVIETYMDEIKKVLSI